MEKARIMIVEDEGVLAKGIERKMETLGYTAVGIAFSGEEAIPMVEQIHPDLVLMDIKLAGQMDGIETAQQILEKFNIPVIYLTAFSDKETIQRAKITAPFGYILKPVNERELHCNIEMALYRHRIEQENIDYIKRLSDDLAQAAHFQKSLLPEKPLDNVHWYIEGRLRSCDTVSGDTFTYIPLEEGVAAALGDVSGHGVRAAMYTGMLILSLRSALHANPYPRQLLQLLRQETDFFESTNYASLVYCWLTNDGACHYFSAGHPDIFWQHQGAIQFLNSTAPLLMNFPVPVPDKIASISLAPGDRLVICSDGLLEAQHEKGEEFGKTRMQDAIRSSIHLPVPKAIDAILACMDEHCQNQPQADDITLLIIERR